MKNKMSLLLVLFALWNPLSTFAQNGIYDGKAETRQSSTTQIHQITPQALCFYNNSQKITPTQSFTSATNLTPNNAATIFDKTKETLFKVWITAHEKSWLINTLLGSYAMHKIWSRCNHLPPPNEARAIQQLAQIATQMRTQIAKKFQLVSWLNS